MILNKIGADLWKVLKHFYNSEFITEIENQANKFVESQVIKLSLIYSRIIKLEDNPDLKTTPIDLGILISNRFEYLFKQILDTFKTSTLDKNTEIWKQEQDDSESDDEETNLIQKKLYRL